MSTVLFLDFCKSPSHNRWQHERTFALQNGLKEQGYVSSASHFLSYRCLFSAFFSASNQFWFTNAAQRF